MGNEREVEEEKKEEKDQRGEGGRNSKQRSPPEEGTLLVREHVKLLVSDYVPSIYKPNVQGGHDYHFRLW